MSQVGTVIKSKGSWTSEREIASGFANSVLLFQLVPLQVQLPIVLIGTPGAVLVGKIKREFLNH